MDSYRLKSFFDLGARFFFAATVVLIPFRWRLDLWVRPMPPLYSDYTNFLLSASDIALICLLSFWACSLFLQPRTLRAGDRLAWVLLVGLTIVGWVSVLGSEDPILSRYHAIRFVILLFFYLYIVNEIASPLWLAVPVAMQVLTQSVAAIAQSLNQRSVGLQRFGEYLLEPDQIGVSIVPISGMRFLRAYGLSDHPNILGGCLSFGLILLLAVFLYGNKRSAWISAPIFLLGFAALVMTFSRSAWLSLMVAASFMVGCEALARRWDLVRRAILLGGVGILVLLPFFVSHIEAFQSRAHAGDVMGDEQIKERLFLMEKGNTLFVEHSAIGVGLGASPLAMKKRFGEFPINIQPPHYAILTAVLEIGLFGGMFYGILMLLPFLNFAFRWRSFIDQPFMKAAVGLLLAICIVGVFDYYTWFYAPGRLWQWLAWGLYSSVSTKAG